MIAKPLSERSVVVAPATAALLLLALLGVTLAAAGEQRPAAAATHPAASAPASSASAAASAPASPENPVVDVDGLKVLVARARGKVVLLDFWATWCAPCVQGLPRLAEWRKRFGDKDLQIIAVSFDDPKVWTRRGLAVLRKAGWSGAAVVVRDRDSQNEIVAWLGLEWRSELPAQYVLDRDGRVVAEWLESRADKLPPVDLLIERQIKAPAEPTTRK